MTDSSERRPRILVIDDEPGLTRLLELELTDRDFNVLTLNRPQDAIEAIERWRPDAIVLDLLMPVVTGDQLLARIRERWSTPVIVLTALDERLRPNMAVAGHEVMTKPMSASDLAGRLNLMLRRGVDAAAMVNCGGGLEVDLLHRLVLRDGHPLALHRKEWLIIRLLALNSPHPTSGERLLTDVWGAEYAGEREFLRVWMQRVRRALGEGSGGAVRLRGDLNQGYWFGTPPPPVAEPEGQQNGRSSNPAEPAPTLP